MGVKDVKAVADKRYLSHSMVNIIRGENLKALRRPNKDRKHNSNIFKDRDNRSKRLALLSRCFSK